MELDPPQTSQMLSTRTERRKSKKLYSNHSFWTFGIAVITLYISACVLPTSNLYEVIKTAVENFDLSRLVLEEHRNSRVAIYDRPCQ